MRSKKARIPVPQSWDPCIIRPGSYLDLSRFDLPDHGPAASSGKPAKRFFPGLVDLLGPAYARFVLRAWPVHIQGVELLVDMQQKSAAGEPVVFAFRHPGDADPHLVYYALVCQLKKSLPQIKGRQQRLEPLFLSGADLVMWDNPLVEWALCAAGCAPVRHGGGEARHMDRILELAYRRRLPLVLAPESQIAYHSQSEPDLDPGIAWIARRLQDKAAQADAAAQVRIVPLHVQYHYPRETWRRLDRFVGRLEALAGVSAGVPTGSNGRGAHVAAGRLSYPDHSPYRVRLPDPRPADRLRERLLAVWDSLLEKAELVYGLPPPGQVRNKDWTAYQGRALAIAEAAMAQVERFYRGPEGATLKSRIINLRARILDTIIQPDSLGELDAAMAAVRRNEAFWLQRHIERADLLEYLDPGYIMNEPGDWIAGPEGFTRLVETAQNLWDLAMRLAGGSVGWRSRYFRAAVTIAAGNPVGVGGVNSEGGRKSQLKSIMDSLALEFRRLAANGVTQRI